MPNNLTSWIQHIVQECVKGMKMADVAFGTVMTADPLSVQIDNTSLNIPEAALILTDPVVSRVENVINGQGGYVNAQHGLAIGDKLVMMRVNSGQRYIILSKVMQ